MSRLRCIAVVLSLAACPKSGGDDTGPDDTMGTMGTGSGTDGVVTSSGPTSTGEPQGPPMAYCPGVPEWSYPLCREQGDCEGDNFPQCRPGPDDCPGAGCEGCVDDVECVEEGFPPGVCSFPPGGCCAHAGTCVLKCTMGSCAADESCAADGHCVPVSCEDGFTCPQGQMCGAGAGADRHGCRVIPCDQPGALACPQVAECLDGTCTPRLCSVDADCPCGTCIMGGCWDRPWICVELSQ